MKTVWSFGGGTQSCAIAALIIQGKIPRPDLAVIADTGREVSTTWTFLKEVIQPALDEIDLKIHVIPHSFERTPESYNYYDLYGGKDKDTLLIPAYTNITGKPGMLRLFCNAEWKRDVVKRFCRREHGIKSADLIIGFSTDEVQRFRTYQPNKPWQHIYPLWDLRLNRGDCIALVEKMGWGTPPRSACWMCPYRTDHEWREILGTPDFDNAVKFEKQIQERDPHVFLHKSCKPINEIDFELEPDSMDKPCGSGFCFT